MLTKRQIRELRAMAAQFEQMIDVGNPEAVEKLTVEAYTQAATMSGLLASAIPYLLDEIERLQGQRPTPQSSGFVKFSASGGRA